MYSIQTKFLSFSTDYNNTAIISDRSGGYLVAVFFDKQNGLNKRHCSNKTCAIVICDKFSKEQ